MSVSLPPPSEPQMTRVGVAVALVVPAAAVAVLPAALRLANAATVSLPQAWAALAGLVALPLVAIGFLGRRAARGWRAIGPDDAGLRLAAAGGWLAWTGLLAVRVGAMLRAKTHHHALAAVTFAIAIAVLAAVLALVSRRILALLRDLDARRETLARALAVAWVAAPLFGIVLALRAAAPDLSPGARATIIDGAALFLGGVIASRTVEAAPRPIVFGGPFVVAALGALAVMTLHESPVRSALEAVAPLLARFVPH